MELLNFFKWLNDSIFAVPTTLLFFGVGIFLTIKNGFLQIRGLPRFVALVKQGLSSKHETEHKGTINSFHAMFTAMATTIGVGNVVGPSVAIMMGGPGALFWLILYIIVGSATKFTEVVFAIVTRTKTNEGNYVGGPVTYLASVYPWLGFWYGIVMIFLFMGWSGLQANTLAQIFAQEGIPAWITGLGLSLLALMVLSGGAKRVGEVASTLVPIMFVGYVSFSLFILLKDWQAFVAALKLVWHSIFSPAAAVGAFAGASIVQTMRVGIFRGIHITESGTGTSSIPHALADVKNPTDQGILAMFSASADAALSFLSGMLVLVTGLWMQGEFRSTLIYEAYKLHSPVIGQWVLLVSISLFVLTTVIGNSFNGIQSFTALMKNRWVKSYIALTILTIFIGSMLKVQLIWEMMDTLLTLVVIPNLIGLVILTLRRPEVLKVK